MIPVIAAFFLGASLSGVVAALLGGGLPTIQLPDGGEDYPPQESEHARIIRAEIASGGIPLNRIAAVLAALKDLENAKGGSA